MDSSVRDKIEEEEAKSMNNAEKNPSPSSAGSSDNSSTTTVVVGSRGKRKEVNEDQTPTIEPSLKRICATPSSDESTLVQNAQGLAKIEEEVKSIKHAEKNPSPNSAGSSDNSTITTVVDGSTRKRKEVDEEQTPPIEPSLKRICGTPSSDESTLVQNAQGLAKNEEEVKSMKHAEKNPSPNSAGSSDNSSTITSIVGSTRKRKEVDEEQTPPNEPSLKRISATPSDDSSEKSTLVKNAPVDKEQTPPIEPSVKRICGTPSSDESTLFKNAQVVDSDTDSNSSLDDERRRAHLKSYEEREEEWSPTGEEWDKYVKQMEASKGFDVDFCYRIHGSGNDEIVPLDSESIDYEDFQQFMKLAADKAPMLEDLQLVKANRVGLGRRHIFYFTFIAKGSSDGVVRCYQSKFTSIHLNKPDPIRENKLHFVWLKDECGQVAAEDIKQREGCGADSLRQLYMVVFCPIEPVSRDDIRVCRVKYRDFMKLAVKACNDSGGQKLKDLEVVEAYQQIFGLTTRHYISFKGYLDGECRFYQAIVTTTCPESVDPYDSEEPYDCEEPVYTVELVSRKDPSVRLKDEHGQVIEERIKHRKQNEARKCFDVEQTTDMKIPGVITPVDPETLKGEDYKHFMEMIIAAAKVCGGQEEFEEDLHIEKANQQCFGCFTHHYITFSAKGSLDGGKCRHYYQAKFTRHSDSDSECECYYKPEFKDKVEFVWLKE